MNEGDKRTRRVQFLEGSRLTARQYVGDVQAHVPHGAFGPLNLVEIVRGKDVLLTVAADAFVAIEIIEEATDPEAKPAQADTMPGLPNAAHAAQAILSAFGSVAACWSNIAEAGTFNTPAAADFARTLLRELGYEVPAIYRDGRHAEARIASAMGRAAAAQAVEASGAAASPLREMDPDACPSCGRLHFPWCGRGDDGDNAVATVDAPPAS